MASPRKTGPRAAAKPTIYATLPAADLVVDEGGDLRRASGCIWSRAPSVRTVN